VLVRRYKCVVPGSRRIPPGGPISKDVFFQLALPTLPTYHLQGQP